MKSLACDSPHTSETFQIWHFSTTTMSSWHGLHKFLCYLQEFCKKQHPWLRFTQSSGSNMSTHFPGKTVMGAAPKLLLLCKKQKFYEIASGKPGSTFWIQKSFQNPQLSTSPWSSASPNGQCGARSPKATKQKHSNACSHAGCSEF